MSYIKYKGQHSRKWRVSVFVSVFKYFLYPFSSKSVFKSVCEVCLCDIFLLFSVFFSCHLKAIEARLLGLFDVGCLSEADVHHSAARVLPAARD